jgi:hypothetical protein
MTDDFSTPQRQPFPKDTPVMESTVSVSKDGRYLIHRTTITHIKPVAYYEAVLRGRTTNSPESAGLLPIED